MNLYVHDLSLFDFSNFSDNPIITPQSLPDSLIGLHDDSNGSDYGDDGTKRASMANPRSPPKHRHDGTSPLPLGMDWSTPPRRWDGRDTVWPHDPHTGWSYCVTIPSWVLLPKSGGSDPVVFYRVQVGIQSPEGVTSIRGILRRFSDFLKLLSELKKIFPMKNLPPAPPKRILSLKSRALLDERRCSLEDWMEKLLSDIDISRSASVATFLELEAAVRSFFDNINQSDAVSSFNNLVPSFLSKTNSDTSLIIGSSVASDKDNTSSEEISELGTPRHGKDSSADPSMEPSTSEPSLIEPLEKLMKHSIFNKNFVLENLEKFSKQKMQSGRESDIAGDNLTESTSVTTRFFRGDGAEHLPELGYCKSDGHVRRLSTESIRSDLSSVRASEISNLGVASLFGDGTLDLPENAEAPGSLNPLSSDIQFHRDLLVVLLSDERHKLKRVLNTLQRRLATVKTDMEDIIARLNQEVAVKQFLETKVKDLEVELETTRENCDENMQQAVLLERERFTQMQWDMEELRKQCLEMELKLKTEQDERARVESAKLLIIQESKMLLQELDLTREQLANLHKHHEESEVKSKADVKLLVKEVKSLRSSQSELKQELSRVMKEKLELERLLQKEKQKMELANAANTKLLRECNLLRDRLQECSVNFLSEEEDKLIVDTSSPSDALDLLTTSDNRIGLLLAEAQLLAQDVESSVASLDESHNTKDGDKRTDDELRKMLTDIFVDNARLRKQVNSVIRCALNTYVKSDEDEDEEEAPLRKTVLSKFL